jgi:hypothetical protein
VLDHFLGGGLAHRNDTAIGHFRYRKAGVRPSDIDRNDFHGAVFLYPLAGLSTLADDAVLFFPRCADK